MRRPASHAIAPRGCGMREGGEPAIHGDPKSLAVGGWSFVQFAQFVHRCGRLQAVVPGARVVW